MANEKLNHMGKKEQQIRDDQQLSGYCFEVLSVQEKLILENGTTLLHFEKGETIVKEGYAASHVFLLESGMAKLDVLNDGRRQTVKILPPHSFIGIVCSFAGKNMEFSSVALSPSVVHLIDRDAMEELVKNNGEFACRLIKHMSFLSNEMIHSLTRFHSKNVDGALAILLLDMLRIFNHNEFKLPLTRKEMAEIIGYSKESVIHALSRYNREGIIVVNEKNIQILDEERLLLISKTG